MRSSASSERIQSLVASEAAKFFCATYPGQGRTTTRSVTWRASATVSSVLSESTTMISSAQRTEASAAWMCADSFLVMTVTESFGTAGSVLEGRKGQEGREGQERQEGREGQEGQEGKRFWTLGSGLQAWRSFDACTAQSLKPRVQSRRVSAVASPELRRNPPATCCNRRSPGFRSFVPARDRAAPERRRS